MGRVLAAESCLILRLSSNEARFMLPSSFPIAAQLRHNFDDLESQRIFQPDVRVCCECLEHARFINEPRCAEPSRGISWPCFGALVHKKVVFVYMRTHKPFVAVNQVLTMASATSTIGTVQTVYVHTPCCNATRAKCAPTVLLALFAIHCPVFAPST